MAITLPTKKTSARRDVSKITMLLYGAPKIGKSTFCSRIDDALFIATEPGLAYLDTFNVMCKSWQDIKETIEALKKDTTFKTIIIDTIDNYYFFCVQHVLNFYQVQYIQDLPYGKGTAAVTMEFEKSIRELQNLGKGIVFISHAGSFDVTQENGQTIKRTAPTIPDKCRNIIIPLVDIIGYATKENMINSNGTLKQMRVLNFDPSSFYEAGDRTGFLPKKIPFSYSEFSKYFAQKEVEK